MNKNRAIIDNEITQGAVGIGLPKAYKYDAALVETAKAIVEEELDIINTDGLAEKVVHNTVYKLNAPLDVYGAVDNGTEGQILRTKGDGNTEWVVPSTPSDEQVAEVVTQWLDDHPEATTTVEDGSLTRAKFTTALDLGTAVICQTAQQMIADTSLKVGYTVLTKGYHSVGDGGGALYVIRAAVTNDYDIINNDYLTACNTATTAVYTAWYAYDRAKANHDTPENIDAYGLAYAEKMKELYAIKPVIVLNNGNVAEMICDRKINVKQFGAVGNANYFNYADNKCYANIDLTNAQTAIYEDNTTYIYPDDKTSNWYAEATFTDEGVYEYDGKHWYDAEHTIEAPYHDNVADKWYVTATYSNKANAYIDGVWYSDAEFSTEATDDTDAIQMAIKFAESFGDGATIEIPTICRVTTLKLYNLNSMNKEVVYQGNGGLFSVETHLFDSASPYWWDYVGMLKFIGLTFMSAEGNGFYVMPGWPFVNIKWDNCNFINVDTVTFTDRFLQSHQLFKCTITGGNDYIFKAVSGAWNTLSSCRIEKRHGGLVKQIDGVGHSHDALELHVRIVQSGIQNIYCNDLVYVKNNSEIVVDGCAFERVPYVINAEPITKAQLVLTNNMFEFKPWSSAWCRLSTANVSTTTKVNYVFENNQHVTAPLLDATDTDVSKLNRSDKYPVSFVNNFGYQVTTAHSIDANNDYNCLNGIEIITNDFLIGSGTPWFWSTKNYFGKADNEPFRYRLGILRNGLVLLTNATADGAIQIKSGDDLNSYTYTGTFISGSGTVSATLSNTPVTASGFKMIVMKTAGNYCVQEIFVYTGGLRYIRGYNAFDETWGDWNSLYKISDNLTVAGVEKSYNVISTNVTKGTAPASDTFAGNVNFSDADGVRLQRIICSLTSSGTNFTLFRNYRNIAGTDYKQIVFAVPSSGNASFRPSTNNDIDLGASSYLWKEVYAGTGTINTSDERLKENIESIPDDVLDAWGEVCWYQYQFKDSIAEKGKDKARIHTGAIAQRIKTVFESHGLDAFRYGLLCYDEWESQEEVKNKDGDIVTEAREAGNRYSLRYQEALCMESAYQRRRADRLEARIQALEESILNRR